MIRVIFNQKGGVGKSSITSNLAAISADYGFRTLAVDLDVQCNTTQYLLGEAAADARVSIADFFADSIALGRGRRDPMDFVTASPYENLDVIAASPDLADLQHKLESKHKIYKLRDALAKLAKHYEAIYIDTPPAFNFYTLSALIGADSCLIPFDCDDFARNSLYRLLENLEEVREDHNPRLRVEGIIVNQFQSAANFPAEIVQELRDDDMPVLKSILSSSVIMRESHHAAVPLVYFSPNHKLTLEYLDLFEEINASFLEFDERRAERVEEIA